jgi:hypothetical protein
VAAVTAEKVEVSKLPRFALGRILPLGSFGSRKFRLFSAGLHAAFRLIWHLERCKRTGGPPLRLGLRVLAC